MRQIRTSGSMSGDGKRGDLCCYRAHPRLYRLSVNPSVCLRSLQRRVIGNATFLPGLGPSDSDDHWRAASGGTEPLAVAPDGYRRKNFLDILPRVRNN